MTNPEYSRRPPPTRHTPLVCRVRKKKKAGSSPGWGKSWEVLALHPLKGVLSGCTRRAQCTVTEGDMMWLQQAHGEGPSAKNRPTCLWMSGIPLTGDSARKASCSLRYSSHGLAETWHSSLELKAKFSSTISTPLSSKIKVLIAIYTTVWTV